MRKLRILQVIKSMSKGGAERYAADLTKALTEAGHETKLVSFSEENEYVNLTSEIDFCICKSVVQPSISGKSIVQIDEYRTLVKKFNPDVIHSHLFKSEMISREYIHPNTVYISTCQNNMEELDTFSISDAFSKRKFTNLYEKNWMLKRYKACNNHFIAISRHTEAYYKKVLPSYLNNRIRMIHHAIDFRKFNVYQHDRSQDLDEIKLIYVARFAPYKNHRFLIHILEALQNRTNKSVKLEFVGSGVEEDNVRHLAEEKGLSDSVIFSGLVSDVEMRLKEANFYIHPATYEPFGLVIIEAMATGLPVIALNGKGNRDIIEHGVNGYMFDEENAKLFANQIIELSESSALYKTISQNAINYAAGFDMVIHVQRVLDYYHEIINVRERKTPLTSSSQY
ncbi:glycosyltransferase [Cryomorphaceae bacterium 1068]|nr:glycosyltransferase [Cryomorphaceae bacterium 1068]